LGNGCDIDTLKFREKTLVNRVMLRLQPRLGCRLYEAGT
jgi:hypothetical protein